MIHYTVIIYDAELLTKVQSFSVEIQFLQPEQDFLDYESSKQLLKSQVVDLIFLEARIEQNSGFDFYKLNKNNASVIFFGKNKEDAFDAFSLDAIDFLDYEFDFKRFVQAVNKAKMKIHHQRSITKFEDHFLHIRSDYKLVKIAHSEINYFETLDDYIKIHLLGKKPILTLMSMKTLQSKLPSEKFIRVHRSFVVPIHKIQSVRGKVIDLGFSEIPIGKSYEADFFKMYLKEGY
jgi:DNA-binding LytR/AlgR family response regulator